MKLEAYLQTAASAALSKKAEDVVLLDLRPCTSFTDYFLLATGANMRQLVAIADAVMESLRELGMRPNHAEGYPLGEWILLDYGSLIIHVFTPAARGFYDLERLWGGARRHAVLA